MDFHKLLLLLLLLFS